MYWIAGELDYATDDEIENDSDTEPTDDVHDSSIKTLTIKEAIQELSAAENSVSARNKKNPKVLKFTYQQTTAISAYLRLLDEGESKMEATARRWMLFLGFKCTKQGKGYYTDGHNRHDVVTYR